MAYKFNEAGTLRFRVLTADPEGAPVDHFVQIAVGAHSVSRLEGLGMEVLTLTPQCATVGEVDHWVKSLQNEAAKAGEFAKSELRRMEQARDRRRSA